MNNKKIKILICDDSLLTLKKLREHLPQMFDCTLFEARNGLEAVDLYINTIPDLVLLDIVMPEMNGIEALQKIISYDSKAKVVMLSSAGTQANLKKAITLGACDFIQKPVDYDNLEKIIKHTLFKK